MAPTVPGPAPTSRPDMEVSINGGTTKGLVYKGKSENPIKMDDLGYPHLSGKETFFGLGRFCCTYRDRTYTSQMDVEGSSW